MTKFTILVLGVLLLAGCSIKKNADDMKSSMDEMKGDTKRLETSSKDLVDGTENLQHEMTFDRCANSMDQYSRQMWGVGRVPGEAAVSEPAILMYAGMTIKAMWSQFWYGDKTESVESLDERMETSTEILMVAVKSHSPSDHQVSVKIPNSDYKGVAALGAKLEFTRHEFERALVRKGLPSFTYYDVVIEALRNRDALTRTEQFPLTTAKILQFQQDMIYMLQLRHNFLPMMVLSELTNFKDQGLVSRYISSEWGMTANLDAFDPEQLKEWTIWLKAARQTRNDLSSMGIAPEYNATFSALLQNLDFGQERLMALPATALVGKAKLQREFAQAFKNLEAN